MQYSSRKLKPSQVGVSVMDYERSHGKLPRGEGSWAFCMVHPNRQDYLDHVLWKSGSYRVAKQAAKVEAAALGVDVLYVCS